MVYIDLSRDGKSFIHINTYWGKLFLISCVFFFGIFLSYIEDLSMFSKNGMIFFLIMDFLIAAFSLPILEDFDPLGYYLSLFWTMFAFLVITGIWLYYYKNIHTLGFSLVTLIIYPLFFSLFNGTIFLTVRYSIGKVFFRSTLESTNISSYYTSMNRQIFESSIAFVLLIILDLFYYSQSIFYFFYPPIFLSILFMAFLASFVDVYITYEVSYNMSVAFIIIVAILPILEYNQAIATLGFLKLMLLLTVLSLVVYLIGYKEEIDPKTGIPTGAVIGEFVDIIGGFVLLIAWLVSRIWINFSLNYETVLFIMLPIAIGSIVSDTIHGYLAYRKIESIGGEGNIRGAVGGVAMGDGLWAPTLIILTFYLIFSVYY